MGQKTTHPIPTQTEKQPKPKNQTAPNNTMGWGNPKATHPHKTKKTQLQTTPFFDPLLHKAGKAGFNP